MNVKLRIRSAVSAWGLFAYEHLKQYTEISQADFDRQLTEIYTKRKPKTKRFAKSALRKYGRYELIEKEMALYNSTKDARHLKKAQELRNRITANYRIKIKIEGFICEWIINPYTHYKRVERLFVQMQAAKTREEANAIFEAFRKEPNSN